MKSLIFLVVSLLGIFITLVYLAIPSGPSGVTCHMEYSGRSRFSAIPVCR